MQGIVATSVLAATLAGVSFTSVAASGRKICTSYLGSVTCVVESGKRPATSAKRSTSRHVSGTVQTGTTRATTKVLATSTANLVVVLPTPTSVCPATRVPCAPTTPKAPAVAAPTPEALAHQLAASMVLPKPTPKRSPDQALPDGRPTTYVKLSTWFYVPAAQYKPKTVRAQLGTVWAEATATPVALTFIPGDGSPGVACAGPGRAWVYGQDMNDTPPPGGCGYTYTHSSYGQPGGMVTATYGIQWDVTWTGSGGAGGTLPSMQTTSTSTFAVAEAQAVVVAS